MAAARYLVTQRTNYTQKHNPHNITHHTDTVIVINVRINNQTSSRNV